MVKDLDLYINNLKKRESILNEAGRVSMKVFSEISNSKNLTIWGEWISMDHLNHYMAQDGTQAAIKEVGISYLDDYYFYNLAFHRIIDVEKNGTGFYVLSRFIIKDPDNYIQMFKNHYYNDLLKELGVKEIQIYMKMKQRENIAILGNWKSEDHYISWLTSAHRIQHSGLYLNLAPPEHKALQLHYFC